MTVSADEQAARLRERLADWPVEQVRLMLFEQASRWLREDLPVSAVQAIAGSIEAGVLVGLDRRDAELVVLGAVLEAVDARRV